MKLTVGLVLLLTITLGCKPSNDQPYQVIPNGGDKVAQVPENDPEMQAAEQEAKSKIDTFIDRLTHAKQDEKFSVKTKLPTAHNSFEHIWVSDLTYNAGTFEGTLDSDPVDIPDKKAGAKLTIAKEDVEDWIIASTAHGIEGGFTSKVIFKNSGQPPSR